MPFVSIELGDGQAAYVKRALAKRVQQIDFDLGNLGNCQNDTVRADLLAERVALVTALGEFVVGEAQ